MDARVLTQNCRFIKIKRDNLLLAQHYRPDYVSVSTNKAVHRTEPFVAISNRIKNESKNLFFFSLSRSVCVCVCVRKCHVIKMEYQIGFILTRIHYTHTHTLVANMLLLVNALQLKSTQRTHLQTL